MLDRVTAGFLGVITLLLVVFLAIQSGALVDPEPYGNATVTVHEERTGATLATVDVRIAETDDQRYVGLGNTSSLGPDEGMLFVHDEAEVHGYVMRGMSFPLDILFVAPNGTITTIHHAPLRGNGANEMEPFEGHGKYVLEVNRGWANRTNVSVGDTVEIPEAYE